MDGLKYDDKGLVVAIAPPADTDGGAVISARGMSILVASLPT